MSKKQWFYFAVTLGVLGIEVLIALFVHDGFIRPYIGDIFAVVFVYCAARIFLKKPPKLLALYVFAFAVFVEFVQILDLARLFGLSESGVISTIAGGTFDIVDIALYAVGAIIMFGVQIAEVQYSRE